MAILGSWGGRLAGLNGSSRVNLVRQGFGLVMVVEVLRYLLFGWVDVYFVDPAYHFSYPGFDWVEPLPRIGMMAVFLGLGLASSAVLWGYRVRLGAMALTVCFAYIFLIDQTYYQNHWVLILWLGLFFTVVGSEHAERRWALWLLRFQVGVVYAFAGIAKLNADWLVGQPMDIWLSMRSHWPLIGGWLNQEGVAVGLSWAGLAFDLCIVPLLLWRRTRCFAFWCAVMFHAANAVLFKIGIFPILMVVLTTVFLPEGASKTSDTKAGFSGVIAPLLVVWVGIQLALPVRHWFIPGDVAWTEEGHRFSWRMKTRSKVGRVVFHALDKKEGVHEQIERPPDLTPHQIRKMSTRPGMIRQYALHLANERAEVGSGQWAVHVDARAKLNHHAPRTLIDPSVDLVESEPAGLGASWILHPD